MYQVKLQALARHARFPVAEYGPLHFSLSPEVIGELRVRSYLEQWKLAIANQWFHVKLADHSLFLFKEGIAPSYSFLHCPIDVPSFAEFLSVAGVKDSPASRRSLVGEYQLAFDTAGARASVTPIRFDYDPNGYRAGVHPASHIHIGLQNQIRISVSRMTPVSFFLFVMRQMYPEAWARLIEHFPRSELKTKVRPRVDGIPPELWSDLDEIEHRLV